MGTDATDTTTGAPVEGAQTAPTDTTKDTATAGTAAETTGDAAPAAAPLMTAGQARDTNAQATPQPVEPRPARKFMEPVSERSGPIFTSSEVERGRGAGQQLVRAYAEGVREFKDLFLVGANLSYYELVDAHFTNCDLRHANLSGSNLGGATFTDCALDGAQLSGALLNKQTTGIIEKR